MRPFKGAMPYEARNIEMSKAQPPYLNKGGKTLFSGFQGVLKGVENSGRGKTYHKTPPPKTGLDHPTYDTFPPPAFIHALSFPLEAMGTDQTNPSF